MKCFTSCRAFYDQNLKMKMLMSGCCVKKIRYVEKGGPEGCGKSLYCCQNENCNPHLTSPQAFLTQIMAAGKIICDYCSLHARESTFKLKNTTQLSGQCTVASARIQPLLFCYIFYNIHAITHSGIFLQYNKKLKPKISNL